MILKQMWAKQNVWSGPSNEHACKKIRKWRNQDEKKSLGAKVKRPRSFQQTGSGRPNLSFFVSFFLCQTLCVQMAKYGLTEKGA